MNEFYCSARGDLAKKCLEERLAQRAKLPHPPIQIIYPSKRTVEESVVGEQVRGFPLSCLRAFYGLLFFR